MSSSLLHQRTADTLKQRTADTLKHLVSAPQWIWTVKTAIRGIADWKLRHIRPHGNFMLSGVFNGWGDVNRHSSIISPLIAMVKMFAVSLVARWRTAAFSQFCLQIALPYKKGNRKLLVPWSSFNTHCTTNNACACQSCDSRTVCTSWKYHGPLTVYITASDAAVLSLTAICTSSRIYVLLCLA